MARDDYYMIVAKILVYLYKKVKDENSVDLDYLTPGTSDFPIGKDYFLYVLEMMQRQDFIEGLYIKKAYGDIVYESDWSRIRILPKGIDYLRENETIRKICSNLKEAVTIMSLFV